MSDHAFISTDVAVDIAKYKDIPSEWKKVNRQMQNWDTESKEKIREILDSPSFKTKLDNFCNMQYASSSEAAAELTFIIQDAVKRVFPRKIKHRKSRKLKSGAPYSHEVQIAKRIFKKAMRHYNKDKHNLDRRQNYIREKKNYKKAIYKAKKVAQQYKLNRLADLEQSYPKRFWADIKSILRPRDDSASCIDHGKWLDHFRSLLHPLVVKDTNQQFAEYIDCSLPTIEGVSERNRNLNKQISHDELNIVIKELKTGKATYLDEILNEFIKATAGRLRDPLLHLFNTVIRLGDFPIDWSDGLIIPIHKKDNRLSVDNYRGIIISSCLGKVFVKILTRRIDNYMRSSGQWSMNQ